MPNLRKIKKIGLVFSYDERWIGGTYYIVNLIHALNQLDEKEKPILVIFSSLEDFEYLVSETQYPYLQFEKMDENPNNKILKAFNRITIKLFKKKVFKRRYNQHIDAVFPFKNNNFLSKVPIDRRIYWIPDFQEKHFPEYYTEEHLLNEIKTNSWIAMHSKKLLLSSESALSDLKLFYPEYKTRPCVVHFAVKRPDLSNIDPLDLRKKYELPNSFFFSPNQFWKHKNQLLVIKAVEILKSQGKEFVVAFSGKEFDTRNPEYTTTLKNYVQRHKLEKNIKFLGFIDRREQLKILELSLAVLQPSLFEGWSTVIEEAMALNKVILASDLDVNKEQLKDFGLFFDKHNPEDLAFLMEKTTLNPQMATYDYKTKQHNFALDFMKCVYQ